MTSAAPVGDGVSAERLLRHAVRDGAGRFQRPAARLAERIVRRLLRCLSRDQLTLADVNHARGAMTYGRPGDLHATIVVHDPRAYLAVIREGAIGLGRGYLEHWWSSPDPVSVVRVLIRNLAAVDRARDRLARITGVTDLVRRALPRHTRRRNKDDIGAHYDIGNAFFALFLDDTMTYSSAVFCSPDDTLEQASIEKYDRLLAKLDLRAGHHLLEIGTGWGAMAMRAVEATGCHVTTTTISDEQLAEARRRVATAGLDGKVTLLGSDWRDLSGVHDRVVSIEMIEAVDWRDYGRYFATIERCLRPDGLAAIQAICVPDARWGRTKNTVDFVRRFVFPNGNLPSVGAIGRAVSRSTRLQMLDVEDFGAHYAETLMRWRERFDQRLDEVRALGLDDRFCRLWRFYLAYCEAAFRERHCAVVQVLLAGPEWRGSAVGRLRPDPR